MKFLGLDSTLVLSAGLFGLFNSLFLLSSEFTIQQKFAMIVVSFGFVLFLTIVQKHLNDLELESFKRGI